MSEETSEENNPNYGRLDERTSRDSSQRESTGIMCRRCVLYRKAVWVAVLIFDLVSLAIASLFMGIVGFPPPNHEYDAQPHECAAYFRMHLSHKI
jgi:hypothetical protein